MLILFQKFAYALIPATLIFGCSSPPPKQTIAQPSQPSPDPEQTNAPSTWLDAIRQKIRNELVLPAGTHSGITAVFTVVQLPTGEVLSASLKSSSGNPDYDNAAYRAILKASPLPKPNDPSEFVRTLVLKFTP